MTRSITLLLAIASVTGSAPAHADAKYSRKPDLRIDVTLSARTRPSAPPQVPLGAPAVTADDVMRVQDATQTVRVEQEAILAKLVAETPDDDPDKPELMFRLAEHFAQQQRFWRLKSIAPTMPAPRPRR